jgi:hypothetical protein
MRRQPWLFRTGPGAARTHLVALGLALLLAAAPATAQEQAAQPERPPVPPSLPPPPVPASAEPWFRGGTWMLTAQFGGSAFTDFQRGTARPLAEADLPDFRRRVSARTTGGAGLWAAYWVTGALAVRGGVGYAPSSFTVWHEPEAQRALDTRGEATPEYAGLGVLLADAGVMFRFPLALGRVVPYGMVGGGVIRYGTRDGGALPPEAQERFAAGEWHGAAGTAGLGAAIPLQRGDLLLTFELTSHFSRTPLGGHGEGALFELAGVALELDPDGSRADGSVGTTSAVRLMVGITRPFR